MVWNSPLFQTAKLQGDDMQITFSERELEDFLCTGKNLQKYLGLIFVARQVRIEPMGIIDILAFDWDSKSWVIIELKREKLDLYALAQGLSYINFYDKVSNYKDYYSHSKVRKFKLLLIGQTLDKSLEKIARYFGGGFDDNWSIYYKLFGFNLEGGLCIHYQCPQQEIIEDDLSGTWDCLSAHAKQTAPINYFMDR